MSSTEFKIFNFQGRIKNMSKALQVSKIAQIASLLNVDFLGSFQDFWLVNMSNEQTRTHGGCYYVILHTEIF